MSKNKTLIIVGMGRSGTSLTASWLRSCGLHMGSDFGKTQTGNVKGSWEDQEIRKVHSAILKENSVKSWIGVNNKEIFFPRHLIQQSKKIINKKNTDHEQWGFKDPLSALVIKEWHKLIPGAEFLFVYRNYNLTVDSIKRMEQKIQKTRRNKIAGMINSILWKFNFKDEAKFQNKCLTAWKRYNFELLDYFKKNEITFTIVNASELSIKAENIIKVLNQKGFDLNYNSLDKVFDSSIYNKNDVKLDSRNSGLIEECELLYQQLEQESKLFSVNV